MKERFTVTIIRNGIWFDVWVESNETGKRRYDLVLFLPSLRARLLKREIIKGYKSKKKYKKTYEI